MRLEVNTNGAWRIVLSGVGVIDDGAQLDRIKAAAAELTRAGAELMRRPPTWRLVRDWWEVLGVLRTCTLDEARAAYRRAASAAHPDRGGTDERMAEVNRAWEQAQEAAR